MNKELVEMLASKLFGKKLREHWEPSNTTEPLMASLREDVKEVLSSIDQEGYVIINRAELFKGAGLVVAEERDKLFIENLEKK